MSVEPLVLYNSAFLGLHDRTINWKGTHMAAILCTEDYVPSLAHATYQDIINDGNEVATGGGHDYEPKAVGTRDIIRNDDQIEWKSAAVEYGANVSISAQYLVLVEGNPADLQSTDKLIGYVDFGSTRTSTTAAFSYTPDGGVWYYTTRLPCPE